MAMPFTPVVPPNAPPPLAPYCSAARVGDIVHVSGMLAVGPDGATVGVGDIRAQTRHVLDQISAVLEAAGGTLSDVFFNQIMIKNRSDYAAMNEIYAEYFPASPPARYCIVAELVRDDFLVEIVSSANLAR